MKKILKDLLFITLILQTAALTLNVLMHIASIFLGKEYPLDLYLLGFLMNLAMPPIIIYLFVPCFNWLHDKLEDWL